MYTGQLHRSALFLEAHPLLSEPVACFLIRAFSEAVRVEVEGMERSGTGYESLRAEWGERQGGISSRLFWSSSCGRGTKGGRREEGGSRGGRRVRVDVGLNRVSSNGIPPSGWLGKVPFPPRWLSLLPSS